MVPVPGSIDGFTCQGEIGRGGFGIVHRARQEALGREIALKLLPGAALDETAFAAFSRECRALGAVANHPNIATVYACGVTEDGAGYLAMELLEGGTLTDRASPSPLPWRDAAVVGVALAGALETAHRVGVLHRDIKPENVLFDQLGTPKLLDFGIASVPGGTVSRSQAVSLTLAHAAPEILAGARGTTASDIYSLGSTLFAAVHGCAAFARADDETLVPLLARIAAAPVPDLRPDGVPDDLCRVLEHAMAKDPADRPLSAEALGVQLAAVLERHGGPAVVPPVLQPRAADEPPAVLMPGRAPSEPTVGAAVPVVAAGAPHRRRRNVVAAAAGVLLLAAVGAVLLVPGRPSPALAGGQGPAAAPAGPASSHPAPGAAVAASRAPSQGSSAPTGHRSSAAAEPVVAHTQQRTVLSPPAAAHAGSGVALTRNEASSAPPSAPPVSPPPVVPVVPAAPAAPTAGAAQPVATLGGARPSSVRVAATWSAGTGGGAVTRYQVRRTLMSGFAVATPPITVGTSGDSVTVLVPAVGQRTQWYRWQVRAVGPGGRSAWVRLPAGLADLTGTTTPAALAQARASGLRTRVGLVRAPGKGLRGRVYQQSLSPGTYPGGTRLRLTSYRPRLS